jgi:hypothetical protein
MVLPLKRWKSRASPGIAAGALGAVSRISNPFTVSKGGTDAIGRRLFRFWTFVSTRSIWVARDGAARRCFAKAKRETKKASGLQCAAFVGGAGWSSPVARQAHNLKVVGSNPTPATNRQKAPNGAFFVGLRGSTRQSTWIFKIGDHVCTLLRIGNARIDHLCLWNDAAWLFQILEELLFGPDKPAIRIGS